MEVQIGEAAGKVWQALSDKGVMPKSQLQRVTNLPPDLFNQAIGWLAREGKLTFEKGKSGLMIGLKG